MFDKLDAYNLVANLVPGAALVYALDYSGFPTPDPNSLGSFLVVSFVVGVMTNRLGSLIVDPVLRKLKFLHQKDYISFVSAENGSDKLETLVANAGLYRTFFTAGAVYFVLIFSQKIVRKFELDELSVFCFITLIGMVVSLFAFQKEDGYIHKRIKGGKQ
jgi:hypothetical protein